MSTLGPLSVVLREEPDLRSVLSLLSRYEHSYNEAMRMRLEETDDIATVRLWFEFGEPAPADQALALGAAALHGIVREYIGPRWRALATTSSSEAAMASGRSTGTMCPQPGIRRSRDPNAAWISDRGALPWVTSIPWSKACLTRSMKASLPGWPMITMQEGLAAMACLNWSIMVSGAQPENCSLS